MWWAKCQETESALTEPITAISRASISMPATSTILVDRSIAKTARRTRGASKLICDCCRDFSAFVRAELPAVGLNIGILPAG